MKKNKILVVGSASIDLTISSTLFPKEGETIIGKSVTYAPGGKGANQAVQAARLGNQVTFVGKLGDDANGKNLLKVYQKEHLNTSHLFVDKNELTGNAFILLEEKDKETVNRIIVVPGSNMRITKNDISFLKDTISEYDFVMLQLEIPVEINEAIAEYAYIANVPVMLNPAPYTELSHELLKRLAYISPNEFEASLLSGIKITRDKQNKLDMNIVRKAAEKIHDMGVKNVLITLGNEGSYYYDGFGEYTCPVISGINAVDPTAAGDSFVAAFVSALASGLDYINSMKFATQAASFTVSRLGAMPSLPTLEEINNRFY